MNGYDLHVHSNASDGRYPPRRVVRRAAKAGLTGVALTDHDTTAGLIEAHAEGERLGIEVLVGCEITSAWRGASVHMLAYHFDPTHPRLVQTLRWIRENSLVRAEMMVANLNELGVAVTVEQVIRAARGKPVETVHVAHALVETGAIGTLDEAFTPELIGEGGRAYVGERTPEAAEVIAVVAEAGGASVLAHPIWLERENADPHTAIEELVAHGLDGVEVHHPDHDLPRRGFYAGLAVRYELVRTSSSDFHGNRRGGELGENTSSVEVVEALRHRARRS